MQALRPLVGYTMHLTIVRLHKMDFAAASNLLSKHVRLPLFTLKILFIYF